MGLSGTIDNSVYEGLNDVLKRYPLVRSVTYEPNSIVKKYLRAEIDPARVSPPTGPKAPMLEVEWRFTAADQHYRIHYADPNTGFNCGWHRDDDHADLGPVHFQFETPTSGNADRQRAQFEKNIPTEILWTALDRLFEDKLPALSHE